MCIGFGMTPEQFWNSTMNEMLIYLEKMRSREECRFRDMHYLASLIRIAVVSAFNSNVTMPSFDDVVGHEDSPTASNTHTGWEDSKAFMKALQNRRSKNDNGSA